MLFPNEAKRIKLFSVSFVAQSDLDKFIEKNRFKILVTRSGNKTVYKPSIEDVDLVDWQKFLSWIKSAGIIIYIEKDKEWKIYKWKKQKSKLSKTKVLDLTPKRRMKKFNDFENPDKTT